MLSLLVNQFVGETIQPLAVSRSCFWGISSLLTQSVLNVGPLNVQMESRERGRGVAESTHQRVLLTHAHEERERLKD